MIGYGAIPIINENDTVSAAEIKFGDNDTLSALVASLVEAEHLIILSTAPGLIDLKGTGEIIPVVEKTTPAIQAMAGATPSDTAPRRTAWGDAPSWENDGRDWPNRIASRFLRAGGMRWHVQVMGTGPALLLVHGTGAATHSWRDLAPILAERFTVIAPDLPGHGFSDCPPAHLLSLPAMAQGLASLLGVKNIDRDMPTRAIGADHPMSADC
eukprot:gene62926-86075_t